jgi:1,4-alpha-glucan branching enzyme
VIASLNDEAFENGYIIPPPGVTGGLWKEIFNSDATRYGGRNVGNRGATLSAGDAGFQAILPANSLVVFQKVG